MSAKREDDIESNGKPSAQPKQDAQDEPIMRPGPNDVLMGRGAPSTDYSGNLHFRELVKERRNEYVNAKRRKDKQVIAGEIIATVKRSGGRFLERAESFRKTNQAGESKKVTIWNIVDDRKTLLVKVKQLMRDVGPEAQQKRNQRRELRRQNELESFATKSTGKEEREKTPSINPAAAPAVPAGLPVAYFPTGIASYPGAPGHSSPQAAAGGEEALTRLRLDQESALRQEAFLRHQMLLHQQQPGGVSLAHFPAHPHNQNALYASQRDAFLRRQLGMAQEEAFLQQQLQQRSQMMMQHPQVGLSLPLPSLASQGYMLQSQQLGGAPPNSLLAAIMRRNAEPSPGADLPKPSAQEEEKERK